MSGGVVVISAVPLVVGAPARLVRDRSGRRAREREQRRVADELLEGADVNFGAYVSLREAAAIHDHAWYFAYVDEVMQVEAFRRRVLDSFADFLDLRNVDSREFFKQRTKIVEKSIRIGDVSGSTVVVGDGNVTTLHQQQKSSDD